MLSIQVEMHSLLGGYEKGGWSCFGGSHSDDHLHWNAQKRKTGTWMKCKTKEKVDMSHIAKSKTIIQEVIA